MATAERQVRAVFANYRVKSRRPDGSEVVGLRNTVRGGMIDTSALVDGELERLERNGALMPSGKVVPADRIEEHLLPASVFGVESVGSGAVEEAEALATTDESLPRTDAPDVEDTAGLSEFIKAERLNVAETVNLAEGDPDRARYVLEAEKAATGQDPRKGVEDGLTKIIEG